LSLLVVLDMFTSRKFRSMWTMFIYSASGVESGNLGWEICQWLHVVRWHNSAPDSHCWRPCQWGGML